MERISGCRGAGSDVVLAWDFVCGWSLGGIGFWSGLSSTRGSVGCCWRFGSFLSVPGLCVRVTFLSGAGGDWAGGPEDLVRKEKKEEERLCEVEAAAVGVGPGLARGEEAASDGGLDCCCIGGPPKSRGGDWDWARSSVGGMKPRFLFSQVVEVILVVDTDQT